MVKKSISLRPSDAQGRPPPLDLADSKAIRNIHKMSFDDFCMEYSAPPLTTKDYFDMRWCPDIWGACAEAQPRSHLFLYTHCLLSTRLELKDWRSVREQAKEQCADTGDEGALIWLNKRPRYVLSMESSGDRCTFPSWNEQVRGWFHSEVKPYHLTARLLFLVYSSKVMLDSGADLRKWRPVLEREWSNWERWITDEIASISRFFRLV